MPEPSFEPYTTTTRLAGGVVVPSPLRDYRIDLDDVLRRVGPRTKLVCLTSPHNPTGTVLDRAEWERFCARCPQDVMVLLDEAYIDFIEAPARAADGLAAFAHPAREPGAASARSPRSRASPGSGLATRSPSPR